MVHVIIFAGGTGTRMSTSDIPKQFIKVDGKPIIIRTLKNFETHNQVDNVVIACLEDWIPYMNNLLRDYHMTKVTSVVPGGKTGYKSIHNGLLKLKDIAKPDDIILICDGVRPTVSPQLITSCIIETQKYGTAVPVVPSIDSILFSQDGITCKKSLPRNSMFITQAPQGYTFKKIYWAHQEAEKRSLEDPISSSELLISLDKEIHLFPGERENIKVTTPEDLETIRSYYYYDKYKQFAREKMQYGF